MFGKEKADSKESQVPEGGRWEYLKNFSEPLLPKKHEPICSHPFLKSKHVFEMPHSTCYFGRARIFCGITKLFTGEYVYIVPCKRVNMILIKNDSEQPQICFIRNQTGLCSFLFLTSPPSCRSIIFFLALANRKRQLQSKLPPKTRFSQTRNACLYPVA